MPIQTLKIFTDGGSRGNPGLAASAFVVFDAIGTIIFESSRFLGVATNNQAEYTGLIMALDWLTHSSPPSSVNFYLDSELVVKQLSGAYKIKDLHLQKLFSQVQQLLASLNNHSINFSHVPRAQNTRADLLVNRELDLHPTP